MSITLGAEEHLRHRFYLRDIQLLELRNVSQDRVELLAVSVHLAWSKLQMSELGDSQDVLAADFHAGLEPASAEQSNRFVAIGAARPVDSKEVKCVPNCG